MSSFSVASLPRSGDIIPYENYIPVLHLNGRLGFHIPYEEILIPQYDIYSSLTTLRISYTSQILHIENFYYFTTFDKHILSLFI